MLSRYGVPTVEAAVCRMVGVSDRTSSLHLGRACPYPGDVQKILDWLAGLELSELVEILKDNEIAARVFEDIRSSQVGNPGAKALQDQNWSEIEVRGIKFNCDWRTISQLDSSSLVELQRERDNIYDPNAISVVASETKKKLGYLDRNYAKLFASLMDEGMILEATVSKIEEPTEFFPMGRLFVSVAGDI